MSQATSDQESRFAAILAALEQQDAELERAYAQASRWPEDLELAIDQSELDEIADAVSTRPRPASQPAAAHLVRC